jgi:23S rRNA pseudouridine2605 synthase
MGFIIAAGILRPDLEGYTDMRLAQFLAAAGIAARRKCESLIEDGLITVNGAKVYNLGASVAETDDVRVEGRRVIPSSKSHFMLYKPVGYTCSAEDKYAEKLAVDLMPKSLGRLFTVGRLDRDSEGLLLLTNDGEWANLLAHPRHGVTKLYRVSVSGPYTRETLAQLRKGVLHEGEFLRPLKVVETRAGRDFAVLEFTLNEGKKREIRRLCQCCGLQVEKLMRMRVGPLKLLRLKPGDFRELTLAEVEELRQAALTPPAPKGLMEISAPAAPTKPKAHSHPAKRPLNPIVARLQKRYGDKGKPVKPA